MSGIMCPPECFVCNGEHMRGEGAQALAQVLPNNRHSANNNLVFSEYVSDIEDNLILKTKRKNTICLFLWQFLLRDVEYAGRIRFEEKD